MSDMMNLNKGFVTEAERRRRARRGMKYEESTGK
jgi:hypothetical protein